MAHLDGYLNELKLSGRLSSSRRRPESESTTWLMSCISSYPAKTNYKSSSRTRRGRFRRARSYYRVGGARPRGFVIRAAVLVLHWEPAPGGFSALRRKVRPRGRCKRNPWGLRAREWLVKFVKHWIIDQRKISLVLILETCIGVSRSARIVISAWQAGGGAKAVAVVGNVSPR